jgi:hypothetical protein
MLQTERATKGFRLILSGEHRWGLRDEVAPAQATGSWKIGFAPADFLANSSRTL